MQVSDAYPMPSSIGEQHTAAIQRMGVMNAVDRDLIEATSAPHGDLWALQKAIFHARMGLLKSQIERGVKPCRPANVVVEVRVTQDVIDADVPFDGYLPDDMSALHYITSSSDIIRPFESWKTS